MSGLEKSVRDRMDRIYRKLYELDDLADDLLAEADALATILEPVSGVDYTPPERRP
jgi:hypothetical protein